MAAQIGRIKEAAQAENANIMQVIEETESGKEADRRGIALAMALARKNKAVVVVAKYDRLSRDLTFASKVVFHTGVQFKILGFPPEAMTDPLLFGVYFGMAQREAQLISERTKAALAEKRKQGIKLGNPNGATCLLSEAAKEAGRAARTKAAEQNSNNIASANEIRRYLQTSGKRTLQAIADHLTAVGCYTSRGVFHTPQSVKLLCKANNILLK